MANLFFSSDWHLGHENLVLKFKREDGSPLRRFASTEEHDEFIIEQHNKTVKPSDHFYMLGDATMKAKYLPLISRFNGHLRMVRGNHDIFPTKKYLEYFDEIYATRVLDNMLFTHIPVHPLNLGRFLACCHGHVHQNSLNDARYYNLSMENLDGYRPLALEELKVIIIKRQKAVQILDEERQYKLDHGIYG